LPIKDGHTRRSYNILKGLGKKNQVHFLAFYETPEEILPENINELKSFCHEVEFFPAPPKKFGLFMIARLIRSIVSREPYTIWRHYSKAYLKRVDDLISTKQFDIVHCDILPLAYTIRDKKSVFRAITDHDVSYLKCLRMGQQTSNVFLKLFCYFEAWKLKRLEGRVFGEVNLGITVSEMDKVLLEKICPEGRFEVIENGVDVEKFKADSNQGSGNTLIWLGGFDHYPNKQGIFFFLENIYPKIKEECPEIKFDIVGGGIPPKLQYIADIDKSIRLLGYVKSPLPYMQGASVFVVPVLSGGGTRLKVLEAMAVGKPVVTTTIGCEGINGMNEKHYIIADEPQDFVEATLRLLRNDSLRTLIGSNARKLVEDNYDYDSICNKLNQIYQQALKDRVMPEHKPTEDL
jgi:glycosyltransferase involved in cell wall biosynthesis